MNKNANKWFDAFFAFNLALFFAMGLSVYLERFIVKRGEGHLHEFFIYGTAITAVMVFSWWKLRRYAFKPVHLALVEFGILMHFAGGLVVFGGTILYQHSIFGIGYDKYVHFVNSFVGMLIVEEIFRVLGYEMGRIKWLLFILVVLGCGAVVEIIEYIAKKVIRKTLVGEYDNNMQDLITNFVGSLTYAAYRRLTGGARGQAERG